MSLKLKMKLYLYTILCIIFINTYLFPYKRIDFSVQSYYCISYVHVAAKQ